MTIRKKLLEWLFVAAAFVAIITFIFIYIDISSENAKLKNRVAQLEIKIQELLSEREGLINSYHNLLVILIREQRISVNELSQLLPAEEIKKIEGRTSFRGNISFPASGSTVSRAIIVEGETENVPSDFHIWLMVEIGNLHWPKEPEININSSFQTTVHEGGYPPQGRFKLSLYAVGPEGNEQITAWFDEGRQTGSFPGLTNISESFLLDSVALSLH